MPPALLVVLAQGLDRRYGRLYAYLQDDLTKPFATPGLALDLLCRGFVAKAELRSRFAPTAPLIALGLLQLGGDEMQALRVRPLQMDDHLAAYLMGADINDGPLGARLIGKPEARPRVTERDRDAFLTLFEGWPEQSPPAPSPLIAGEVASGRRTASQHLAAGIGRPLLIATLNPAIAPWRAVREALLQARPSAWQTRTSYSMRPTLPLGPGATPSRQLPARRDCPSSSRYAAPATCPRPSPDARRGSSAYPRPARRSAPTSGARRRAWPACR